MGTSEMPEIYAQAQGHSPSASVYISSAHVNIFHLGDSPASVGETAGMLCECIYMGPCEFRLWIMS